RYERSADVDLSLEIQISPHRTQIRAGPHSETQPLHDDLHGDVVGQHFRGDARYLLIASDLDYSAQQLFTEAKFLVSIGDQYRHFGVAAGLGAIHPTHTHDSGLPGFGMSTFGDQHHLAVIIAEADAQQSLVSHAAAEAQRTEIPQINTAIGERLVKFDHQRLVFGTDGTDRNPIPIAR